MAKPFDELAARAKANWTGEVHAVYDAARASFDADLAARVELGAMLADARRSLQLSQPALSEATGIQQAEISRIERGVGNPTATTLSRLAAALGKKIALV